MEQNIAWIQYASNWRISKNVCINEVSGGSKEDAAAWEWEVGRGLRAIGCNRGGVDISCGGVGDGRGFEVQVDGGCFFIIVQKKEDMCRTCAWFFFFFRMPFGWLVMTNE